MESTVNKLIGALIFAVIGLCLVPVVAEFTASAQGNLTGASATIIGLVPLFYALGIMIGVVAYVVLGVLKK